MSVDTRKCYSSQKCRFDDFVLPLTGEYVKIQFILFSLPCRLVEVDLSLQEVAAPCLTMCRLHFYANAQKPIDNQVHTLRKSCAGCIGNMVAGNNPDCDVRSDRVREEAAGIAVDDLTVAGVVDSQCWPNVLLWSDPRQYGFWFFFPVSLSLTIYLPTYLSIYVSIYISIDLSLSLPSNYLSIYLSVYLSNYLSI